MDHPPNMPSFLLHSNDVGATPNTGWTEVQPAVSNAPDISVYRLAKRVPERAAAAETLELLRESPVRLSGAVLLLLCNSQCCGVGYIRLLDVDARRRSHWCSAVPLASSTVQSA